MPILTINEINAGSADPAVKKLWRDKVSAANGLTAFAGGGQTAPAVSNQITRFTTVTTAADSARLPPAVPGTYPIVIINAAAANSMNVFPSTGDAINAGAANAAFAVAAGKAVQFFCAAGGFWSAITSA